MLNSTATNESETKSLFAADKRLLFVLLCLFTLLLLFVRISFIENETAAFEFLQDRPEGAILRFINGLKYLSVPLVYAWKFLVIAFVLWVGCFMFGYRVTYSQCWSVVIVSEFIFLVPEIIKIVWFMVIETDPSYHDIRSFYPLSAIHLVNYDELEKRWAYPLRALNVFELVYWILLVYGLNHYVRKSKRTVWVIVACSYILIFFLWLLFYAVAYK